MEVGSFMRETKKSTQEILNEILSGDNRKIWKASCEISSLSQNRAKILELLPYKQQIIGNTKDVDLGGGIYKVSIYLERALNILEFHDQNLFCPCHLLGEFDNPTDLMQDGYFTLLSVGEYNYMGERDCTMRCNQCGTNYRVEPQEYHSIWWKWTPIEK